MMQLLICNMMLSIGKCRILYDWGCVWQQDEENLREPQPKEEVLNSNPHDEVPAEQEQQEEAAMEAKPEEGEQVEPEGKQAPEVPVHQGQPEM